MAGTFLICFFKLPEPVASVTDTSTCRPSDSRPVSHLWPPAGASAGTNQQTKTERLYDEPINDSCSSSYAHKRRSNQFGARKLSGFDRSGNEAGGTTQAGAGLSCDWRRRNHSCAGAGRRKKLQTAENPIRLHSEKCPAHSKEEKHRSSTADEMLFACTSPAVAGPSQDLLMPKALCGRLHPPRLHLPMLQPKTLLRSNFFLLSVHFFLFHSRECKEKEGKASWWTEL